MFCSKCGKQVADGSRFCSVCGAQFGDGGANSVSTPNVVSSGTRDQITRSDLIYPRNPPLSPHLALLTIVWPGIPQIVFGQLGKGIVLVALGLVGLLLLFSPPFIMLPGLAANIALVVDGYMIGSVLKSGRTVTKWAWFPK